MGVEINKFSDIIGVVTTEAIPEGRMVLMTSHSQSYDFGSRTDLPGVKLPDNATEAAKALYVAVFAQDNRGLPLYEPPPAYDYNLRKGWGVGTDNVPMTGKTIYLTHPGNMKGQTIPSGVPALAYGGGIYTVPSGAYVYNANLATPGNFLVVANTADDTAAEAGKLKYSATAGVAVVHEFNSTTKDLTFRTLQP